MSGKHSRTKGHSWEREVAQLFRDVGFRAQRGLEYQGDKGDVIVEIEGIESIMVQCKNSKCPSLWGALKQAKEDSNNSEYILLPLKRSGHGVKKEDKAQMFCCSRELFIKLLENISFRSTI